jgi:hypothetical protein
MMGTKLPAHYEINLHLMTKATRFAERVHAEVAAFI